MDTLLSSNSGWPCHDNACGTELFAVTCPLLASPSLGPRPSDKKVFQDGRTFAPLQRSVTIAAGDFAIGGEGISFNPNNFVQCIAVWAVEPCHRRLRHHKGTHSGTQRRVLKATYLVRGTKVATADFACETKRTFQPNRTKHGLNQWYCRAAVMVIGQNKNGTASALRLPT